MKKLKELILNSEDLVKNLTKNIDNYEIDLKGAEEKILEHINKIGQAMTDEIVMKVKEPILENEIKVEKKNS